MIFLSTKNKVLSLCWSYTNQTITYALQTIHKSEVLSKL